MIPMIKRCGICDNCLKEKNLTITKEEFEKITKGIKDTISESPLNSEQLLGNLREFKENKIRKILNFLQEENEVVNYRRRIDKNKKLTHGVF